MNQHFYPPLVWSFALRSRTVNVNWQPTGQIQPARNSHPSPGIILLKISMCHDLPSINNYITCLKSLLCGKLQLKKICTPKRSLNSTRILCKLYNNMQIQIFCPYIYS